MNGIVNLGLVEGWCDSWLEGGAQFVLGADVPVGMTRYRYVQYLCTLETESQIEKLQWIWLVSMRLQRSQI